MKLPTYALAPTVLAFMLGSVADAQILGPKVTSPDGHPAIQAGQMAELHQPMYYGVPGGESALEMARSAMDSMALTPISGPIRKKKHTEYFAKGNDDRLLKVKFDFMGRISEVSDESHERIRHHAVIPPAPGIAVEAAQAAGFSEAWFARSKRHHSEVVAKTNTGALVELHIDASGAIYKQKWIH